MKYSSKYDGLCSNKKCRKKLIVPTWKYCSACDPKERYQNSLRNKKPETEVSTVSINIYSKLTYKCNKKKAMESDFIIYDENLNIIGYKSPINIKK